MDFVAHYRRAVELAEDADKNYADSLEPVTTDEAREDCLRRAEVLARMSQARGQLAWVAYMGADATASQELADNEQAMRVVADQVRKAGWQDAARRAARRDRPASRIYPLDTL